MLQKEEERAEQLVRYKRLITDLKHEHPAWVTSSNIDEKITSDLFKHFTTTGIVTPTSQYWKYRTLTFHWNRTYGPELLAFLQGEQEIDHIQRNLQSRMHERDLVEDLLKPMISSGKTRAQYKQLVDEFVNAVGDAHGFDDFH